ncbi:MAG: efflux RND transporter periplasmic adaptor subunit [Duodenibacillus sp.]|nr:efflux RND transporter periplasmic adaptor subunit [Duodenibacillus sp.]
MRPLALDAAPARLAPVPVPAPAPAPAAPAGGGDPSPQADQSAPAAPAAAARPSPLDLPALDRPAEVIRAQLVPVKFTRLSAGTSARIAELPFKEGEHFKKGDLLFEFDCRIPEAELGHSQAELKAAAAHLRAQTQLAKLQAGSVLELETARANVGIADARIKLSRERIVPCREFAPFAGNVIKLYAHRYQHVNIAEPVMEIQDPSLLQTDLRVPSRWLRWIKPGTRFTIELEDVGERLEGEIARIGAQVDAVSQTVQLYGTVKTEGTRVLPGMSGIITFPERPAD